MTYICSIREIKGQVAWQFTCCATIVYLPRMDGATVGVINRKPNWVFMNTEYLGLSTHIPILVFIPYVSYQEYMNIWCLMHMYLMDIWSFCPDLFSHTYAFPYSCTCLKLLTYLLSFFTSSHLFSWILWIISYLNKHHKCVLQKFILVVIMVVVVL